MPSVFNFRPHNKPGQAHGKESIEAKQEKKKGALDTKFGGKHEKKKGERAQQPKGRECFFFGKAAVRCGLWKKKDRRQKKKNIQKTLKGQ